MVTVPIYRLPRRSFRQLAGLYAYLWQFCNGMYEILFANA